MITGPAPTLKRARQLRCEMSLPEVLLWRELRKRPGEFKFRRPHPAGMHVLDFFCASACLAIEVDGWAHNSEPAACSDGARAHFLRAQGIASLRVPAKIVLADIDAVVARIVEVCTRRARAASVGA